MIVVQMIVWISNVYKMVKVLIFYLIALKDNIKIWQHIDVNNALINVYNVFKILLNANYVQA